MKYIVKTLPFYIFKNKNNIKHLKDIIYYIIIIMEWNGFFY